MKTFNDRIKQIKRTRLVVAITILILALAILIWGIVEIIPKEIQYGNFDKNNNTSDYVKTKIKYLTGPIIEAKNSKTEEIYYYYIATDMNDELFIVKTGEETSIPIYGKDVTEENINTIGETEIYGIAELTSGSLAIALNNGLNSIFQEEVATNSNLVEVMGAYHFDTVAEKASIANNLFMLAALLAIFGALYLYVNMKIRKRVEKTIEYVASQGKLEEIINEYEGGQLIEYKNVKVSLSPNYLFSYVNGIDIIEISNIQSATISKKQFGSRDKNKYIIITTKDNLEYYIAPFQKKSQKRVANELLEKIKNIIE